MNPKQSYVGLDVHKDTITIAGGQMGAGRWMLDFRIRAAGGGLQRLG